MILTQAQCIKRGYFKKPIVVISKPAPILATIAPVRDWLLVATFYSDCHDILAACSAHFGVSINEMLSRRQRFGAAKYARFSFYYLARELTRLSFPQIGKIIHRDHATVFHGAQAAAKSPEIMDAVNQIKARLVRSPPAAHLHI